MGVRACLTCQHACQVEQADAEQAVHHLQGHPDHQLQESVEPQLLQPNVHEHVGEEAPGAGTVPRVVHEGALHVLGVVGLQHPLVEAGPVAQEHDDQRRSTSQGRIS